MSWRSLKFDEVVHTSMNGFGARRGDGQPTVVLRLADVDSESWGVASSDLRKVGMSSNEQAKYSLAHGDLLVVRVNGSPKIAGRVVAYSGPPGFTFCDHFIRFQLVQQADPRFVAYQFKHRPVRAQVERGMVSTAGQHTVSQRTLASVTVELPSLREQHRIVSAIETHFSRLDAAVASLTRAKTNVKRARASVLKAAVEGRLVPTESALARAEGRTYEPASVLLDRIVTARQAAWTASGARGKYQEPVKPETDGLPELPEGWCWASGEQVSDSVESGTTPSKEYFVDHPGVPFIKVYHLTFTRNLDFLQNKPTFVDTRYHASKMRRSVTRPGDVLTNIVGPPLGKVSIVPGIFAEWNINQAIARFRPLPGPRLPQPWATPSHDPL